MSPITAFPRPRPRRWPFVLFCSFIGLGFLFCCSGIQFPFLRARTYAARHMSEDFGVTLPASAVVTHATWQATNDSIQFFVIEVPAADRDALIDAIESSARSRKLEMSVVPHPWTLSRAPDWWHPDQVPGMTELVRQPQPTPMDGATLYYSRQSSTLFLSWYEF